MKTERPAEETRIAILCVGDELLKGATVNTNLAAIGRRLLAMGVVPVAAMEVPDTEHGIVSGLETLLSQAEIVVTTGGLGPTADDATKEYVARRLGLRLEEDGEAALGIQRYWRMRHPHEEIPHRAYNQALVPQGAIVLPNECGTAPGLILEHQSLEGADDRTIILLPGPPGEMKPMFDRVVAPYLRERLTNRLSACELRIAGLGESVVEDRMLPELARTPSLSAAYCASPQCVRLFLTSPRADVMPGAVAAVRRIFADELIGDESEDLADELIRMFRARRLTLAVAESCTGGLLAKLLTDRPGASDVFAGGVVSYSNEVKKSLLHVSEEVLARCGAVSQETARAMLDGLAEAIPSDAAIALTGIAGPGGATVEKPVGLVYAGVRFQTQTEIMELRLRGSRAQIRERACAEAMFRLRKLVRKETRAEGE